MKSSYCTNIGFRLEILAMERQHSTNIGFALEIFLMQRKYCVNVVNISIVKIFFFSNICAIVPKDQHSSIRGNIS